MKISISTPVEEPARAVFQKFDKDLFLALAPPLLPLKLLRFDGCETGDIVQIQLGVSPVVQKWDALIVDHGEDEHKIYFVDTGTILPFPLKEWKHRHLIWKKAQGAVIEDHIEYSTGFTLLDYLMYPLMYFQFWLRKPIYRKYFKQNKTQ